MLSRSQVELLAPAGDWDCLCAAIANGADAVYLGLEEGHNARARATNFSLNDLPRLLELAHSAKVKIYVALNTLAFVDELPTLERHARTLAEVGVDAVLVQDLGLVRLIKEAAPELPIHASTQMTLTSSQAISMAERLGIERVVLARELSIDEIGRIHRESVVPLEAFVHGALCVAYSGQCLTSESLGGRSANRGECAQACRLGYQIICDERTIDLGEQKYLLSPQDLAAYNHIPQLIAAGVRSLKIEGRLKSPEYVANITRHYRLAIDAALDGAPIVFDAAQVDEMEMSFSRGFSPGWLEGCDHKRLAPALSSTKRGLRLGCVIEATRCGVRVALERPVKRGDGVVFFGDREQNAEQGGRVYEIFQCGRSITGAVASGDVELRFGREAIDLSRLKRGQVVWKTDDPELNRRLRKTYSGKFSRYDSESVAGNRAKGSSRLRKDDASSPFRREDVDLDVRAIAGEPLRVAGRTSTGVEIDFAGDAPLCAAHSRPISHDQLREHLGRLGNTRFCLKKLTACIAGGPLVPFSVLGEARRALIAQLVDITPSRPRYAQSPPGALERLRNQAVPYRLTPRTTSQLGVLCRSLEQVAHAVEAGADALYVDFADVRRYRHACEIAKRLHKPLFLATPRIQKPDEYGLFRAMARHGADGFLVRNLGAALFCQEEGLAWVADFSLNASNDLTVGWLHDQGALRVTASYDLNRDQLIELAAHLPGSGLEAVIHQHMPMFHMEHCVFCALLSPGTNKHDCGRPCDEHQVRLRDRIGIEHPLTADVGCRNTLFNATPQSAAEAVGELIASGVRFFRVELLETTPDPRRVVQLYRDLLDGRIDGPTVWRALSAVNRVGVTRGTLEERRNPLSII